MRRKCNDNDNVIEVNGDEVYFYTEGSRDKLVISMDDLQSSIGAVMFWLIKREWDLQKYLWYREEEVGMICKNWLRKEYPFFCGWLKEEE